ncbi:MAG: hypothetical protein QOI07_1001 [Verrucomicrobiota bacterium]
MKVSYIIDSLRRHGTQRFLIHLTRGLAGLGYRQQIIELSGAADRDIEEALVTAGGNVVHIGKSSFLWAGAGWFRLVRAIRKAKPDVVITFLPVADTLGRPAARLAGVPNLLSSIRARDLAKPRWQRLWDRRTVHWASKIIFNSRYVVEYAKREEGIRDEQVVVIPNGVADLRAQALQYRETTRRELKLDSETIVLGSVGRLHSQKNHTLLLRACAKLPVARPAWKLLVVGDGPDKEKLERLASDLGLETHILWLGARAEVEKLLAAMDVFVHTADFEGMPNALMEAMAMGLPVIASEIDGARELIRDGLDGYLVPAGNVAMFSERIQTVMNDPDLARRFGENAHASVLAAFGLPQMVQAYHSLLQSLAGSAKA